MASSIQTSQVSQAQRDTKDVYCRRVCFELYEAVKLSKVYVKVDVDFEAILKLQRRVEEYRGRRVCNLLPLMMYDDFQTECLILKRVINQRLWAEQPPLRCTVTMKDASDKRTSHPGEVLDYLEAERMFIVEVKGARYFFNRLCIQFDDFETRENMEERRVQAMTLGKQVFLRLNIEHVLFEEGLKMRRDLHQPVSMTNNIERLLGLKRIRSLYPKRQFNSSMVRALVEQFEALYAYSMMKCVIMSEAEAENLKYACMITGFKIERNTLHATPYNGLAAYERNGGPIQHLVSKPQAIEMLKDFSLFGRRCFNKAFKLINSLKLEAIDSTPIFQVPLSEESGRQLLILDPEFGKQFKKAKDLKKAVESYPLDNLLFAKVQTALGRKFKPFIVSHWLEKIVRHTEAMIKQNFKGAKAAKYVSNTKDLNPFLFRFLKGVYQVQVSHLHEKFKAELTRYLEFLLQFANANDLFRNSMSYS